jgi:UDP-2,3-diacylglucosamine pyrophosphatase LpxH
MRRAISVLDHRAATQAGHCGHPLLLSLNRFNHWVNQLFGRPYWSFTQSIKKRVAKAVRYVERFESTCLQAAKDCGAAGVVRGHIHQAKLFERAGLIYCNNGDWVENCPRSPPQGIVRPVASC